MSKIYCKAPWTALFLHPNGDVKCCCAGSSEWGNLNNSNLEDLIVSPKVVAIKADIIANIPNEFCRICAESERLSGASQRSYFDQFEISDEQLALSDTFELHSLDIRWNNLCNLNCVYCSKDWSTTWQKYKQVKISSTILPYHEQILAIVSKYSQKIDSIILAGGEPLLQKQNINLLETLKPDTALNVITNFSIDVSKSPVFRLLRSRELNVNWSISMENVGSQFEYVRHGAKWEDLTNNFKLLDSQHVMLFPVFCIYSIDQLVELYEFAVSTQSQVHWQQLIGPPQLNISNFSRPVREYAQTKISALLDHPIMQEYNLYGEASHFTDFLKYVVVQLNEEPATECDLKFRTWTAEYEEKYVASDIKSFEELWPNLHSIIKS
jgi:sulfatase maturation enzyme AslB (radical SAM superfamily)